MQLPNGTQIQLWVVYCDAQYPNGPPARPTKEEANADHTRFGTPSEDPIRCGGTRGKDPDAFGGERIALTGYLRCGAAGCKGYIRRKELR